MANWFNCKVKYDKTMDTGLTKKVTEEYLVDALTFTEAESRFLEEIEPFMSGEYEVTDIKKARISELFENEDTSADRWFRAKVAFIIIDEKTGAEKRACQTMMIQATDLKNSLVTLEKNMDGILGDYVIVSITETNIIDVYRYKVPEK